MAEWVLKGSLKGPQGDPGQDAQLPAGGTEGQVLTKTADGEAWADAPQPDMTGVVKMSDGLILESDGSPIEGFIVSSTSGMATYATVSSTSEGAGISAASSYGFVAIGADTNGTKLTIVDKTVTSITDAISDSPDGNALVTDKAVADYVAANAPSVTLPLPVSQGGTGATTADGAAMMVFAHAPEASPMQAGVVKTLSDKDFCAYMGMEYDPADWS